MTMSRRHFVQSFALTGASVLLGCRREASIPPQAPGTLRGVLPFINHGPYAPVNTVVGEGLDGRLYTGIETLTRENLITPTDRFYVRTRCPKALDTTTAAWSIRVDGLVERELQIALQDMMGDEEPMGIHLMECAGNDLMTRFRLISAAKWTGIPIGKVLSHAAMQPSATAVVFNGVDDHPPPQGPSLKGASWYFPIEQLESAGAFLATRMNDQPLTRDHGQPVRLFVPGWYGCACIKWVNLIRFVDDRQNATGQMVEFAKRTGQTAAHRMARDYLPAVMEHSATPIRVEQHRIDGRTIYRVVGVMWGGSRATDKLQVRLDPDRAFAPVTFDPPPTTHQTWTLWTYDWKPTTAGNHTIELQFADEALPAKRVNSGYYNRQVYIASI